MSNATNGLRLAAIKELVDKHKPEFDEIYIRRAQESGLVYKYSQAKIDATDRKIQALIDSKIVRVR